MPGDLFQAAEHRGQIMVADHLCRPGQMPGQDGDLRTRPKDFAQCHAFGRMGDKEPPSPGPRQRKTDLGRAKTIGIGLDHACRLDTGRRESIKGTPVLGNGVEVNIQGRGSDAVLLTQPGRGQAETSEQVALAPKPLAGNSRACKPEDVMPESEDDCAGLYLTVLCWIGLGLATLDAFLQPLPWGLTWAMLAMSDLAGGIPAARSALAELWHEHRLDIDLLMVVAALAAASVGAALEGAVLLALFSLSQTLEHRAMGKARRAVEALMQLRPEFALREGPDGVTEAPVADLVPGDRVILRPGARVPVDGRVADGSGHLDESTVTGELAPGVQGCGRSGA